MMTDDGSYGEKGLVTDALEKLINEGNEYDEVIAIGPLIMMKFVCLTTKKYDIKTVVSMNPIMIDEVGVERLEHRETREDLSRHRRGVRHAGAADRLDEGFLDDAVLDVERELASALLRCAPANTMREAADILDVLGFDPFAFLRDWSSAVMNFLRYTCHVFHFL